MVVETPTTESESMFAVPMLATPMVEEAAVVVANVEVPVTFVVEAFNTATLLVPDMFVLDAFTVVSDVVDVAVRVPTVRLPIEATDATSESTKVLKRRANEPKIPLFVEVPVTVEDAVLIATATRFVAVALVVETPTTESESMVALSMFAVPIVVEAMVVVASDVVPVTAK